MYLFAKMRYSADRFRSKAKSRMIVEAHGDVKVSNGIRKSRETVTTVGLDGHDLSYYTRDKWFRVSQRLRSAMLSTDRCSGKSGVDHIDVMYDLPDANPRVKLSSAALVAL